MDNKIGQCTYLGCSTTASLGGMNLKELDSIIIIIEIRSCSQIRKKMIEYWGENLKSNTFKNNNQLIIIWVIHLNNVNISRWNPWVASLKVTMS